MINHFIGTKENPYHLSVGAVVRNEKGEICSHYFSHFEHKAIGSFDNFHILMRETIEPNETIEACLARGLMEEFGISATLHSYLGSIVSRVPIMGSDYIMEKTTIYFLCDLVSIDPSKRKEGDPEAYSEISWLPPQTLIQKMKEQGVRLNREDADESVVVERAVKFVY